MGWEGKVKKNRGLHHGAPAQEFFFLVIDRMSQERRQRAATSKGLNWAPLGLAEPSSLRGKIFLQDPIPANISIWFSFLLDDKWIS